MASSNIRPIGATNIPNELLQDLVRGTCVIVVGSGLSASALRLPTWTNFVKQIKDHMPEEDNGASEESVSNYRLEYLDYVKRRHPARYKDALERVLTTRAVTRVHRSLAELPAVAIITTNLDTLIEDAIRAQFKNPIVIADTKDIPQFQEPHRPLVIKMHGSVNSEGQVLTLGEYQSFDLKNNAMKALVLSYLIRHPLLIIGAGLTDPNFLKLYSIVHDTFGRFHHPAFYVTDGLPSFVREVWQERNFRFIPVPPADLSEWLQNLVSAVKREKENVYSRMGIKAVTASTKRLSLLSLGDHLGNYSDLQRLYTTQIHMPDYCFFTEPWEQTLYAPLRESLSMAIQSGAPNDAHLVYLAPGSHAPGITSRRRVLDLIARISFMDIDLEVVTAAKSRLKASVEEAIEIDTYSTDFTAGAGQLLCNLLSQAFETPALEPFAASVATADGRKNILEQILPEANIPFLADGLFQKAQENGFRKPASVAFSEMVASFTATAVLMAFRSKLYLQIGKLVSDKDAMKIMDDAVRLWQEFNDRIYKLHLEFLARITSIDGSVLVAVDTEKQYDDKRIPTAFSFSRESPPLGSCPALALQSQADLFWRDHAFGFDISIGEIPVHDFQSHQHRVKLYSYVRGNI